MSSPSSTPANRSLQIAEEGEAIGTVQQFADRVNLSRPRVLSCLDENDVASIVLPAGDEATRLLIVDPEGLDALLRCADDAPSA
jgi:hypothetical protein